MRSIKSKVLQKWGHDCHCLTRMRLMILACCSKLMLRIVYFCHNCMLCIGSCIGTLARLALAHDSVRLSANCARWYAQRSGAWYRGIEMQYLPMQVRATFIQLRQINNCMRKQIFAAGRANKRRAALGWKGASVCLGREVGRTHRLKHTASPSIPLAASSRGGLYDGEPSVWKRVRRISRSTTLRATRGMLQSLQ